MKRLALMLACLLGMVARTDAGCHPCGVVASVVALAILPTAEPVRDSVDVAEVNHFYDHDGRHVFDQLIFWDMSADGGERVVAWRLIKDGSPLPQRDWRHGGYYVLWRDERNATERYQRVQAVGVRETWTQHDPELQDREALPVERRRELSGSIKR